jgi:hypothetical protein
MIAYDTDVFSPIEATNVASEAHSRAPEALQRNSRVELVANDRDVPSSEPPGRVG